MKHPTLIQLAVLRGYANGDSDFHGFGLTNPVFNKAEKACRANGWLRPIGEAQGPDRVTPEGRVFLQDVVV